MWGKAETTIHFHETAVTIYRLDIPFSAAHLIRPEKLCMWFVRSSKRFLKRLVTLGCTFGRTYLASAPVWVNTTLTTSWVG